MPDPMNTVLSDMSFSALNQARAECGNVECMVGKGFDTHCPGGIQAPLLPLRVMCVCVQGRYTMEATLGTTICGGSFPDQFDGAEAVLPLPATRDCMHDRPASPPSDGQRRPEAGDEDCGHNSRLAKATDPGFAIRGRSSGVQSIQGKRLCADGPVS